MSRRRKALIAAAFSYAQTFLGILVSLYVTRFLVRALGKDLYGVWLASGALLAYAALADFGIFGVFPWLIAEADGKRDVEKKRSLLAHGLALGLIGGAIYGTTCIVLWSFFPRLLHLSPDDRAALSGPILVLAGVTTATFPLRLFSAFLLGLQDYKFMGYVTVAQTLLSGAMIVVLARLGFGLYALAFGSAVPPTLSGLSALMRTRKKSPELLRAWPKIRWSETAPLVSSGAGAWLASLGWQMAFATDGVVIAYLGAREQIPAFVITSRLGLTLMQFGWTLPDAALVGLAQLNAEGNPARRDEVVRTLLRLHLLVSGGIACVIAVVNSGFVGAWIGRDLFGGSQLSAIFAADVVALTVAHAVVTPTAVLGNRIGVGVLTVVNGVVHVVLAVLLGRSWGLRGVAAATGISALVTSVPIGLRMLAGKTALSQRDMLVGTFVPWFIRLSACGVVGAVIGWRLAAATGLGRYGSLLVSVPIAALLGFAYLFSMKSFLRDLPLGDRVTRLLAAVRLA
jgi:O-antigen/teichoic acid export membrane protein